MERPSRRESVSSSMFPLVKIIENEMKGNFTNEEGEKIISHLVKLTRPNDVSEFLFKVKLSIDNISQILIEAILNFQLTEIEFNNETKSNQNIDERLDKSLSISDVVKIMKISRPTLDHWRKNGLQTVKINGRVFIKQSALDNFLKSNEI